ncbi:MULTISPECIES: class I adenylate-forming enzyme family protein [Rhodococcus]|uniref:class I adenylate-forming enzyme family protein n=1 Tax=Rhodococcus TaxID=1827 RepID=UPI000C9A10B3|nr:MULTISPECIES: AMP-binding protein [Rhodococcus]PND51310.1 fatty-acid--CoA ligase [Rhodococcus sp. ENV425]WKW99848.1 AMP-binding protein [Rhodococcus aetherivorans]
MAATVGSALYWWAKTKGEQNAIIVAGEALTYRELQDWSSRVAREIVDRGIKPGERVGVLGPNSVTWPVVALGVLKAGAVLVPLNPRFKPAELRKVVDDAGAVLVIAPEQFSATVAQARDLGDPFDTFGFTDIAALREGERDDFRVDLAPDDPTALLFTSGSTGLSKGVICTNRTLLNIVFEATLTEEGFRPGSTSLLVLPLVFTPGLVWGLVMSTVLGGTLIIEKELDPGRAAALLGEHKVQALFGVPLIFEAISRSPEFEKADLSSLRTAIVGGAAVAPALLKRWADKGVALRQIYGMTEAGGVATATLVSEAFDHPDTCGSGSIFTETKVVRTDGTDAEPGEEGEILLRGPGVTPGYWNDLESTASALRDGWLHSGDLGTLDEGGRVKFVDRLKDLIITGGINVSPVEIERVISGIPGVEEVAVIAASDERFGETPAAIVTVKDGVDAATIVEYCDRLVADYKVPRYVVIRDEPLPRLPSGKLSKTAIRSEYRDVSERFDKVR